jgi:hypothetical protein
LAIPTFSQKSDKGWGAEKGKEEPHRTREQDLFHLLVIPLSSTSLPVSNYFLGDFLKMFGARSFNEQYITRLYLI